MVGQEEAEEAAAVEEEELVSAVVSKSHSGGIDFPWAHKRSAGSSSVSNRLFVFKSFRVFQDMSCRTDATPLLPVAAILMLHHGSVKAAATNSSFIRQVLFIIDGSCRVFVELARGFIILKGEEPCIGSCG